MNVLLIGSGGREHALALKLNDDPETDALFAIPGNPGIAKLGTNLKLDPSDAALVVLTAKSHAIDLVVIGPEAPLVDGLADALRQEGIAVFGPSQAAARLEGSKSFAKDVMKAAGVPTAQAVTCSSLDQVEHALDAVAKLGEGAPSQFHYVVKDDGLAGGKGVVVTRERDEAVDHARYCIENLGHEVVIEEYLGGPEVSLFCLSDGKTVLPLQPAQDFKRVGDGQTGPNTGGMGAYSPLPWADKDLVDTVVSQIAQPTIDEMARRGCPFVGLLYCGLVCSEDPKDPHPYKVIEFNVRFGDPETQVVLPLLASPLAQVLAACARGELDTIGDLEWENGAAVGVIVANEGYPGALTQPGREIGGVPQAASVPDVHVIHCGTSDSDGKLRASGGRVLCVVGTGDSVADARSRAYEAVELIELQGAHYRSDIAQDV